jgi:hypothetical protein
VAEDREDLIPALVDAYSEEAVRGITASGAG